ncbi:MAG: ribonuclease P protein component [Firmicutes bacterium]|nr:ribonuclease P protein component [Bacillota bacterium]
MARVARLRSRKLFAQVLRRGRALGSRHLVLFWLAEDSEPLQVGFAVQRAVGSAVRRNRVRRRLRALAEATRESLPARGYMVWLGKHTALDAPWEELLATARRLVGRVRALSEAAESAADQPGEEKGR